MVENVRAQGGIITREPGPAEGGATAIVAFVKEPNGYEFELLQRQPTPQPLSQVMLRVGDLDRSINFYEKVYMVIYSCLIFCLNFMCSANVHTNMHQINDFYRGF